MRIDGQPFRSIWRDEASGELSIIDQTELPHSLVIRALDDVEACAEAIERMRVRGAPLIGATAAYAIALHSAQEADDRSLEEVADRLLATRPTAINLRWAIDRMRHVAQANHESDRTRALDTAAREIADEDVASCEAIGAAGFGLLESLATARAESAAPVTADAPLEILTHCNAGWLATVDWGTALAPIYKAHEAGLPVHVWVDETRPRNQGASLTAFELREMGVPHTVIVDNAGGHLMQKGRVDAVIVGSDRTTSTGDVCNKIGTYLKALAAADNGVPFFVALPLSTVDWTIEDGLEAIPIEERGDEEVRVVSGRAANGETVAVELFSAESPAANPAFDVTPSRYVTALITDRGVCAASREGLSELREAAAPAPGR